MTGDLQQIVYLSRSVSRLDDAALNEIEATAIRNNQRDNITGLLAYDGRRFIQAFEGPAPACQALLARIRTDPRHDRIDIAANKTIVRREFGSWAMQVKRAEPGSCSREFMTRMKADALAIDDLTIRALFIGFAFLGCGPFENASQQLGG